MFYKMSNALLYSEPMRRLTTSLHKGDCMQKARGFIFICMMADAADNFRPYLSSDDVARLYDISKAQAKQIWEILQSLNVLRQDENGFSVIAWMKENYIYGSANYRLKQQEADVIDENAPASRETLLKVIKGEL